MTTTNAAPPALAKLPLLCIAYLACNPVGRRIVAIRRGERGYYPTNFDDSHLTEEEITDLVGVLNGRLGVTPREKEAMIVGSMFGWDMPGADPDCHTVH